MTRPFRRLFDLGLRRPDTRVADVDEEMRFHLNARTEALEGEGLSRRDAEATARRLFGDTPESVARLHAGADRRDAIVSVREWIGSAAGDIRYAARAARRWPGSLLAVVLTVGLGIAVTTLVYSIVAAVVLRPLPFGQPEELVAVHEEQRGSALDFGRVSGPTFEDLARQSATLSHLAAFSESSPVWTSSALTERLAAIDASATFFRTLDVSPALGRGFFREDDRVGAPPVVILSHRFWRTRFGADPGIIGMDMNLDGVPSRIIGVMPVTLDYPEHTAIWRPLRPSMGDGLTIRGGRFLQVVARRKTGTSLDAVQAELRVIGARIAAADPAFTGWTLSAKSLYDELIGHVRPQLLMLFGAAVLVLLTTCANVGGFLLARGAVRQRELAVRTAIGATRRRIVRQLVTESLVLAVAGGAGGCILAYAILPVLVQNLPSELPRVEQIAIDGRVLLFALATTTLTGVLVGILPAIHTTRIDPMAALKSTGPVGGARRPSWANGGLVVAQFALTVMLLVVSAVLVRSVARLLAIPAGFDARQVVTAKIRLTDRYAEHAAQTAYFEALLEQLAAQPGTRAVGLASNPPVSHSNMTSPAYVEGGDSVGTPVQVSAISPAYFRTVGVALLRGRATDSTDAVQGPLVVVVNEAFVQRHLSDAEPLGRRVRILFGDRSWREIVGVVRDVRHSGPAAAAPPQVYVPLAQHATRSVHLFVRTAQPLPGTTATLQQRMRHLDPGIPIEDIRTLESRLADTVARPRFLAGLLSLFAAITLSLAALGTYGLVSFEANIRAPEFGIRMSLGAAPRRIVLMMVWRALRLALAGSFAGVIGALVLTRVVRSVVSEVGSGDLASFVVALFVLMATTLSAAYMPARRACQVDPADVLRRA